MRNRNQRLGIYLDGVPYFDEVDRLPVDMIQAVEVYMGASVPAQFDNPRVGACGVILLWSK